MLTRKQIEEELELSGPDTEIFLRYANELGILHLSPRQALLAICLDTILRPDARERFYKREEAHDQGKTIEDAIAVRIALEEAGNIPREQMN